jgi:DNA-directed RNA polymerase specialized sigma24 family protein
LEEASMYGQISSGMPNKELIDLYQQDSKLSAEAFDAFYTKWHPFVQQRRRQNTHPDDWADIESEFRIKVWIGLRRFKYRSDDLLERWLLKVLANTRRDYWRRRNRLKTISLDEGIVLPDGTKVTRGERLSCEMFEDREDWEQRDVLKWAAEQCLVNEEQKELLNSRLDGRLPTLARDANWTNVNWHRLTKKVIDWFRDKG